MSRNSLKLECEKLASEKTEMQRHYVMVSRQHNKFKMSISLVRGDRNVFRLLGASGEMVAALLSLGLHRCFREKSVVPEVCNLFAAVSSCSRPAF